MATQRGSVDRRRFMGAALTASAAVACGSLGSGVADASGVGVGPFLRTSKNRPRNIVGQGDYQYEMNHSWAELPERFTWQTTHNVAVDPDGLVYVIHEGHENKPDHPSIFVFDPDGRFVRSFGSQFQGGGHGLEVRVENGTPYLYVAAYQQVKQFAKLTLDGQRVWEKRAPLESGLYPEEEATNPQQLWGRDRFLPTNFAFLADGGFLLSDGYGAFHIHRFDAQGRWLSSFGGPGEGAGTFNTPHGLWIDDRNSQHPIIVVTDRAHHTLQRFELDGSYIDTLEGFGLPANIDRRGDLLMVPELVARVTLLGPDNQVVAHLGSDVDRIKADTKMEIRRDPTRWEAGRFVHPHDACFDHADNIYVAEWVATGRVSKLERIA
jgi:hypothetical protein